jgi:Holliday junction resolvase
MGKSQRDKGARAEREIVNLLKSQGVSAERVPLSGAAHYQGDGHDVTVDKKLKAEVKIRANDFARLYSWLEDNDMLFVRRDRADWLVVMPLNVWLEERDK